MRYLPLIAVLTLIGCARYEYDIVRPPEVAGHVGAKEELTFNREPLEYRMRTEDNRLVVKIYNPTEDPITLMGGFSAAVGPDGQSHPLLTQTMTPGSFIKLIIPPPRPVIYNTGPTWGVGVGGTVIRTSSEQKMIPAARDPKPLYLSVSDDSDIYYWDWKGDGDGRLTLVFERGGDGGGKSFTHDFVIRRVKQN